MADNTLNILQQWQAQGIMPVMTVTETGFSLSGGGKVLTISADTDLDGAPPGAAAWGGITGTLSNQSDLQAALDAKGTSNFNGTYAALTGKPTLGTAAATDATAYATAAQGTKADSAIQVVGYASGGAYVTQLTSKATGVTINAKCGRITMNAAALAAAAEVSFVVTNNQVAATDCIIVNIQSVGTAGAYFTEVSAVSAGSFTVTLGNCSAGSLSQAVVLNFAVIKAVNA